MYKCNAFIFSPSPLSAFFSWSFIKSSRSFLSVLISFGDLFCFKKLSMTLIINYVLLIISYCQLFIIQGLLLVFCRLFFFFTKTFYITHLLQYWNHMFTRKFNSHTGALAIFNAYTNHYMPAVFRLRRKENIPSIVYSFILPDAFRRTGFAGNTNS